MMPLMEHHPVGPFVIAEAPELLAVYKPAGLITHRDGRTIEASLCEWIGENFPQMKGVGGEWVSPQGERIPLNGVVHRLDRSTSGLLLAAKNDTVFMQLRHLLKERRIEKTYRALAHGHMEGAQGTIVAEIARTSGRPRRWYAKPCAAGDARAAVTHWKLLHSAAVPESAAIVSYIEAKPATGRTHQIRVHLASIGHSLVGDHRYDAETPALLGFARPALHAYALSFEMEGLRYDFCASLPEDFIRALSTLGLAWG